MCCIGCADVQIAATDSENIPAVVANTALITIICRNLPGTRMWELHSRITIVNAQRIRTRVMVVSLSVTSLLPA